MRCSPTPAGCRRRPTSSGLRDTTEWVETVESGWNVLVDLDRDAAVRALEREPPAERPELYGGGHAAERVCGVLGSYTHRL